MGATNGQQTNKYILCQMVMSAVEGMKEIRNREFYKIVILHWVVKGGITDQRSDGNERMGQAVIWGRAF